MNSLDEVLNYLGWTSESLENLPEMQVCPLNKGHLVPIGRIENHVEKCRLRLQGYTKGQIKAFWNYSDEEIRKFSESASRPGGIKFQQKLNFGLSSSQSLVSSPTQDNCDRAYRERAFMRDLKRRRQSYRGVHTAKKSYIEVLREVIEHHITLLSSSASAKPGTGDPLRGDREEAQSSKSPDRRSRDSSTSIEDRSELKSRWSSGELHGHSNSHSGSKHSPERHCSRRADHSNERLHHHYRSERSHSRDRSGRRH